MINEDKIIEDGIIEVAKLMSVAAITAPKGKGTNNICVKIAIGEDILLISEKMLEIEKATSIDIFKRDGENILKSKAIVLIGTKINPLNLSNCGLCGFKNCTEKLKFKNVPCSFNTGDLGIALGSAVSIAKDNCVDNRIMYTIGKAVKELVVFESDIKIIYGIPLSVSSKNPFFDRIAK